MLHVRGLLAKGKVHAPVFDTRQACKTAFSQEWRSRYGPEMCCIHSCAPEPLPIFRGLRVRIGIHSGIAEDVKIHTNTKRVVYGGDVAAVAKAVADAPCGGQIIISGETLAEVESMQALSKAVAEKCAGWRNGSAADDATAPAGMSVMHLGTHVIMDTIEPLQEMDDPLENPDESCEGPMPPLMFNNKVQPSEVNAGSGINSTAAILRIPSVLTEGDSVLADVKALRKRPGMILPPIDTPAMNISELILRSSIDATIMKEVLEDDDDTDRARPFGGARASAHTALPEKPNHEPVDASIFDGTRTHELAMVAPWPLMQRVLYFPPPTTKKRVTPPWHEAPEALGVTILFTKIEDTKKIKQWGQQTNSRALTRAISVLQRVARACLAENNGYEMEESEGDFVACFRSPANALNFSTSLQLKLVKAPWDSEVLMTWWGCEHRLHSGMVIFRGPRVAVGMCTGDALRAQPSDRTGRVEYYGPLM